MVVSTLLSFAVAFAKGTSFLAISALISYSIFHLLWRFKVRSTYYKRTLPSDVMPESGKEGATRRQHVCVIGAGPAGLVTAKELLEEGHQVTVFEKLPTFGGVFFYNRSKGGVYDSCTLTIGNYVMAFSDFFEPGDSYRFWKHTEYYDYLTRYVQHFQLETRGKFAYGHSVSAVVRNSDGKWTVTAMSRGQEVVQTFDAVAVCNGAHQKANIPTFPGQETSPIHFCHSETYKTAVGDARFEQKRVVVVGIGETGADVSAEVADAASKAYLSMRRTPHVVPRNLWNLGYPGDAYSTRAMFYCHHLWISALHSFDQWTKLKTGGPRGQAFFKGDMGMGDPVHAKVAELAERSGGLVVEQFLTKNDAFVPKLLDGSLIEKPAIERIEGRTVIFKDGSKAENIDTIALCTGYVDDFPFLKNIDIPDVRHLYKHMFHPSIGQSLALIGFVRPGTGGVPACAELGARYFAMLCSGSRRLPEDWRARAEQEAYMEEGLINVSSGRVKTLVLYGDYLESMAQHVGCQPLLVRYMFTRPLFWLKLLYGAMTPIQYRLRGPHAKPEFAEACISAMPAPTPLPFRFFQSMFAVLGWTLGSLFGFRPTSW